MAGRDRSRVWAQPRNLKFNEKSNFDCSPSKRRPIDFDTMVKFVECFERLRPLVSQSLGRHSSKPQNPKTPKPHEENMRIYLNFLILFSLLLSLFSDVAFQHLIVVVRDNLNGPEQSPYLTYWRARHSCLPLQHRFLLVCKYLLAYQHTLDSNVTWS